MTLVDEYRRQLAWRDWASFLDRLPPLAGQTVLDLGCGVGDLAAALAERGAHVIGIEIQPELIDAARSRRLANVEILDGDLRDLPEIGVTVDGVWASFVAAYFVDFPMVLPSWTRHLKGGGWIALTEVDNLFGHEPLGARATELFEAYARDAFLARRYDFFMGRKLSDHLTRSGFVVSEVLNLRDRELSFDGPASGDVIDAWRSRFDRMGLLRDACGSEFEPVRDDFLRCLADPDHVSVARVCGCLAAKPLRPGGS